MSGSPILAELLPYSSAGLQLIPLNRWDSVGSEGQAIGKAPRDKRWREEQYAFEDVNRWAGAGFNAGVRLRDVDVVVDYDPRNAPQDRNVLAELEMEFGIDLDSAPCVRTGGGGLHFYFSVAAGQRFRNHLDEFPGVEFKSYGRQVVAAGSVHPNGAHYLWRALKDSQRMSRGEMPPLPDALIAAIAKPTAEAHPAAAAGPDRITSEEMAGLLVQLDPIEFREHDDWFELMMACHSATGGAGVEEFVRWSTSDPDYAGHAGVIRDRWNSLDASRPGGVTVGTLYWRVLDAGGSLPRKSAQDDFEAILETGDDPVIPRFKRAKNGVPLTNMENGMLALKGLGLDFSHDEMQDQVRVVGNVAFLRAAYPGLSMTWSDAMNVVLRVLVEKKFGMTLTSSAMQDVAIALSQANRMNPLTEWLDRLAWDKRPRLGSWLVDYAGAPDTKYARAVGRLMLLGAVARAYKPGIKFDTMVVLEGPQGSGKSSLVRILGGQWTLEGLPQGNERDIVHAMLGHWFVEMEEMAHLRRVEVNQLKAFLSRTRDVVRLAYDRTAREIPRRCIIVGTTNDSAYLTDSTGNRRFLPVETSVIDLASLARDRDQLLAEAIIEWRANPIASALELPRAAWGEAADEQEQRRHVDPWEEMVESLLESAAGEGWLSTVDAVSKLTLKVPTELKPQDYARFGRVMQLRRQWKPMRMQVKGVQARGFLLRGSPLWKKWSHRLGA